MKNAVIDLHLHLDGSIHLPWAYRVAKKNGLIDKTMSFPEYYNLFYRTDYKTREEGFKKFDYPIAVLQKREDIIEGTTLLVKELADEGMLYAEIRFAPQQHTLGGLTQVEAVEAVLEGVRKGKENTDIEIGIINCLMHKGENALFNEKENIKTVEATKLFLKKGVVALDLAGFENNGDFMLYAPLFELARSYNIPYTIHAGEMGDGSHVHDAIVMKANRIGHGVNCIQDEAWLKEVVDTQIPLEVCVTSNVKQERNYAAHPITQLIEAGVKVTINTDNRMFSRTSSQNEYMMLKRIGITEEQLTQCTLNSIEAAFCDEKTKEKIRNKFLEIIK